MGFKENLAALPEMSGARIKLINEQNLIEAVIENAPGTAGSFRVYAALAAKHGMINVAAAQEGLAIYAEHTEDARQNSGKHPNIDRLFGVASGGGVYSVLID